ncbi:MAG TPA: AAA family ATPase [Armatimonadota bacterium]|nr:AAA family ATPase [Armatimonadota bacterium]
MIDSVASQIDVLIRARYPILYVISWEEGRVTAALRELVARQNKRFWVWSETMGLQSGSLEVAPIAPDDGTRDPLRALEVIRTTTEPSVFLLRDFHPFFSPNICQHSSAVIRKLRDLTERLRTSYVTVILLSPVLRLPDELEKDVTVIDYDLPGPQELGGLLDTALESLSRAGEDLSLTSAEHEQVLKATAGMTLAEAENVFAKCIVERRRFDVDLIIAEKEQLIRKSGLLEYFHTAASLRDVGGLDLLKAWLTARGKAFSERARQFGLPEPRGLLLLGVQGCGKSLTAKAVASLWQLPLLRLDVGRIFSGYIGSSEENIRKAIKIAEAVSPTVLWLDEIEKGLAGTQSSSASDAGTTSRVFGTIVTWMQEKTAPVFVVATANDITQLPPELLRKGRFDEIFFVDLPVVAERREIFAIHLRRRGRDPAGYDLEQLAQAADGFSGAEVEQAVVAALYRAFDRGAEVTTDDVICSLRETVPLSVTMSEDIDYLREWAHLRTRPASSAQREHQESD